MDFRIICSILFLLFIEIVRKANAYASYRWVPLKFGQTLPENIVSMHGSSWYVGRAKYNNAIVPAKISPRGSAFVTSAGKPFAVDSFEILTTTPDSKCEWHSIRKDNQDKMLDLVTTSNGDPIFIGFNLEAMEYSFVKPDEILLWYERYLIGGDDVEFFECKLKMSWIEHSPSSSIAQLKNKMVSSGEDIYIARLKNQSSDYIIGQFDQKTGISFGYFEDGRIFQDSHFELLIGEPNEYKWVSASNGTIPDYAVAFMKNAVLAEIQISYVTRIDKTIRKLTNIELSYKLDYDILTMNQK